MNTGSADRGSALCLGRAEDKALCPTAHTPAQISSLGPLTSSKTGFLTISGKIWGPFVPALLCSQGREILWRVNPDSVSLHAGFQVAPSGGEKIPMLWENSTNIFPP